MLNCNVGTLFHLFIYCYVNYPRITSCIWDLSSEFLMGVVHALAIIRGIMAWAVALVLLSLKQLESVIMYYQ